MVKNYLKIGLRNLLKHKSHSAINIIVQDTFLRLCSKSPDLLEGKVKQWLFKVCRNRALDEQRKDRRMTALDEKTLNGEADEQRSPDKVVELNERTNRVTKLLDDLPANQREVIRLKFQNGLSYREISEITRLSVSNVGFLIHTGVKTLRRQLQAETKPTFERKAL